MAFATSYLYEHLTSLHHKLFGTFSNRPCSFRNKLFVQREEGGKHRSDLDWFHCVTLNAISSLSLLCKYVPRDWRPTARKASTCRGRIPGISVVVVIVAAAVVVVVVVVVCVSVCVCWGVCVCVCVYECTATVPSHRLLYTVCRGATRKV